MTAGYADNPFLCVFMGMTTGIGGGVLRDMMSRHTPYVLQKRIYAVASIVGAILYWFMCYCNVPLAITQVSAMLLVIGIRMCATIFRWNLPKVPLSASEITNNIKSKKDTNQK
jgi:uncharacterized membrane protein YeiH